MHTGAYDNRLTDVKVKAGRRTLHIDKVKVATKVASLPPSLDELDLEEMVAKTVRFIRDANGLK